jgi:hypothetical protein
MSHQALREDCYRVCPERSRARAPCGAGLPEQRLSSTMHCGADPPMLFKVLVKDATRLEAATLQHSLLDTPK